MEQQISGDVSEFNDNILLNKLICRTCLCEQTNTRSLFTGDFYKLVMDCTSIQIHREDKLPSQICTNCALQVNEAYNFKQQAVNCDAILRQLIFKEKDDRVLDDTLIGGSNDQHFLDNGENNIAQTCSEPSGSYESKEISLLLSSWSFSQEVIQKVTDMNLSIWHLQNIEDSDIDVLFPAIELGDRIKFKFYIKRWRSANNANKQSETPLPDTSARIFPRSEILDEEFLSLSDILQKNIKGKKIIEEYKENKYLIEDDKKVLVDVIAEYLMSRNMPANLKIIDQLSDEIIKLFPSESKATYYTARKIGGNPKGKLYDRIKNLKYVMAKKGTLKNSRKSSVSTATTSNNFRLPSEDDLSTTLIDDENVSNIQNWLKYNFDDKNWAKILEKWVITLQLRSRHCFKMNFLKIIEEWPLFKHPKSSVLIDLDFGYMFPGKEQNLFQCWDSFKNKAIQLYQRDLKDRKSIEHLEELQDSTSTENYKNFLIIYLLHGIIKPTVRLQKHDKKVWKPSIIDSQYSQIVRLKRISDLEDSVAERKKKYEKVGLELQPFIIIVNNCEYYVWIQGILHKFDLFVQALDYCFKIFHCFNFKYPKESELIWLFIQKYLYNINLMSDIECPQVINIISSLSAL